MITKKILLSTLAVFTLSVFTSCSDNNDFVDNQNDLTETKFPIIIDENTTRKEIVVDGETYIFTFHHNNTSKTRAIVGNSETIYERDPNATLATVPVLVSKGKYKKYAVGPSSPFAEIARLDRFEFECRGPKDAKQTSFDITNITPQGFSTENAKYKGFSIDNILSTTSGVIVKCSFYIQNGKAYNVAGQQLTPDTSYPLPGNKVRYQFTYERRK